jgi:hypothetical protein
MSMAPAHALRLDAAPEAGDFFFGNVLGQGSYAKVRRGRLRVFGYWQTDGPPYCRSSMRR